MKPEQLALCVIFISANEFSVLSLMLFNCIEWCLSNYSRYVNVSALNLESDMYSYFQSQPKMKITINIAPRLLH